VHVESLSEPHQPDRQLTWRLQQAILVSYMCVYRWHCGGSGSADTHHRLAGQRNGLRTPSNGDRPGMDDVITEGVNYRDGAV
jgi:hypothetical protein